MTFAVPGGIYDIELTTLPAAPDGYVYTGPMTDLGNEVEANDAITVTNVLTLEIAEGTGTLTKILEGAGDYVSLESEVYFCAADVVCDATTAIVIAGYGEQGQAVNTVSAEVPAGLYQICTAVTVEYLDAAELSTPLTCESTVEDEEGNELPIIVTDETETIVYNDFDAQTEGSLDVNVRDDLDDDAIEDATVCVYNAAGELIECDDTDEFGDVSFSLGAGVYTVNVQADFHEQESSVIDYSPAADAADGDVVDDGLDADVVVALDPDDD